ncbi:MAG: putative sulfate/molybdate transporter [Desulfobacterales bacterium]|nr:MAG: putative sulfate/molybdate transporter [Desulfobacterales bacterium]
MSRRYKFDRLEFAGSLGDLGTLLPLAIGMILINNLNPSGLFLSIGLYYIISGCYFGVPVPVQPMKVIGAYAIATAMNPSQIMASGALMCIVLFIVGLTNIATIMGRYTPKSVVRGVQLSTGILLVAEGVRFMIGTSKFQILSKAAEPYLNMQAIGPVPIGILIGTIGGLLTLLLLENKRLPAGLFVVFGGILFGIVLGTHHNLDKLRLAIHLPNVLPFGFPSGADFTFALFALVLPQIPMTMGNAVIAYSDLSKEYFGKDSKRVTYRGSCISMAFANLISFFLGGMPLCHGAGGLAAHYRFGARTAGSNLIIGLIFLTLAVFLGTQVLSVANLLPMSILGVLLLFAGSQLALTIVDMNERKDLFVAFVMLGITLATNLAVGFIIGFCLAYCLKSERLNV